MHTKGPWLFIPSVKIAGVDGFESVAYSSAVNDLGGVQVAKVTLDEDAEFIVRAANSHESLVTACELLVQAVEQLAPDSGIPAHLIGIVLAGGRSALEKAAGTPVEGATQDV